MKATPLDLSAWVDGYSNVTTDHGQECEDRVHEHSLSMDISTQTEHELELFLDISSCPVLVPAGNTRFHSGDTEDLMSLESS